LAAKKKNASGKTAPAQKKAAVTGKKQAKQPAPHKKPAPHKSPKKPKSPAAAKRSKTLSAADKRKATTKARRAAPAPVLPAGTGWIDGGNSTGPTCVATAVANSLLAVTGYRVTDRDVLELALLAGADGEGVSIEDTLAQAARSGMGGWYPVFWPCYDLALGVIAGAGGTHAVVSAPAGLVSWGGILPDDWELDGELWTVKWRR
jgi:hypothetical protein